MKLMRQDKLVAERRTAWWLVLILSLTAVLNYLDRLNLTVASPQIQLALGLNNTEVGTMLSAFLLPYAIFNLPAGYLVDRYGYRRVFYFSVLGWSVATFLLPFFTSFAGIVACRVLLGMMESPFFCVAIRTTHYWLPIEQRGTAAAAFDAGPQIANAVAMPVLTLTMLSYGWRSMFWILAFGGVLAAGIWFLAHRGHLSRTISSKQVCHQPIPWRLLLRSPTMLGMAIGCFGIYFTVWLFLTWLPRILQLNGVQSASSSGWLSAIPLTCGVVGVFVGGLFPDLLIRRGMPAIKARKIPIILGAASAGGILFLAANIHRSPLVFLLFCLGYFLSQLPSANIWQLAADVAPADAIGTVGALQNFGGYLGASAAPVLTGWLLDLTGSVSKAFLISALLLLVGAVSYGVLVKRPISLHST